MKCTHLTSFWVNFQIVFKLPKTGNCLEMTNSCRIFVQALKSKLRVCMFIK